MTFGVIGDKGSLLFWESYESDRDSCGALGEADALLASAALNGRERTWFAVEYESLGTVEYSTGGEYEGASSFNNDTCRPAASLACIFAVCV